MAEAQVVVKVSEEETRRAVSAVVAAALTPEVMTSTLMAVLDEMMKPPKMGYGDQRPLMTRLFEAAVVERVKAEIDRAMENDQGLRGKVTELVTEALGSIFDNPATRAGVAGGLAATFAKKLSGA